ncbi:unnamed protein product [Symbiodinium sp. KB8]|nr:unnamed protein product [Symbiodinium sp. KB8]
MGKGWKSRNYGKEQRGGGQDAKWGVWRGAWSPSQRHGNWRKEGESSAPAFPKYDSRQVEPEQLLVEVKSTTKASGHRGLANELQSVINQARKTENRLSGLEDSRKRRLAQWQQYQTDLQKSFKEEKERFQRAVSKLDADIAAAREQCASAQDLLVQAAHASGVALDTARAMEGVHDEDWQQILDSSTAEDGGDSMEDDLLLARAIRRRREMMKAVHRGDDTGSGFLRSGAPLREPAPADLPKPSAATEYRGPAGDANPVYASMSPGVRKRRVEPYPQTSPSLTKPSGEAVRAAMEGSGEPPPLEARESSRPRPPPGQREDVQTAGGHPPARTETRPSLGEKLDQRRAMDPGPAMKPFRQALQKPPEPGLSAAPPGIGNIIADDGDDVDLENMLLQGVTAWMLVPFMPKVARYHCVQAARCSPLHSRLDRPNDWSSDPVLPDEEVEWPLFVSHHDNFSLFSADRFPDGTAASNIAGFVDRSPETALFVTSPGRLLEDIAVHGVACRDAMAVFPLTPSPDREGALIFLDLRQIDLAVTHMLMQDAIVPGNLSSTSADDVDTPVEVGNSVLVVHCCGSDDQGILDDLRSITLDLGWVRVIVLKWMFSPERLMVSGARLRSYAHDFPHLIAAAPQPAERTCYFLANPAWYSFDLIACADMAEIDGRVFAIRLPDYVDKQAVLAHVDLSPGVEVTIYAGFLDAPLQDGIPLHLFPGITLRFLPGEQPPRSVQEISQLLQSGTIWDSAEEQEVDTPLGHYCLVSRHSSRLLHLDNLLPMQYRDRLAEAIGCAASEVTICPASPRASDIAIDGYCCHTAIVVVPTSFLVDSGDSFCLLIDCRSILQGWVCFKVASSRLPASAVLREFNEEAPLGMCATVDHVLSGEAFLDVQPGQVLTVRYVPLPEEDPTAVLDGYPPVEHAWGPSREDVDGSSDATDSHSASAAGADFKVLVPCMFFMQDYCPEVYEAAVNLPILPEEFLSIVLPLRPTERQEIAPRSFLVTAAYDPETRLEVQLRDSPWPLREDTVAPVYTGDLIIVSLAEQVVHDLCFLHHMLNSPDAWDVCALPAEDLEDFVLVLHDAEPLLLTPHRIAHGRPTTIAERVSEQLGIDLYDFALQEAHPAITDHWDRGRWVAQVLVLVRYTLGSGQESRTSCAVDARPSLLGLQCATFAGRVADCRTFAARIARACPIGYWVSVRGNAEEELCIGGAGLSPVVRSWDILRLGLEAQSPHQGEARTIAASAGGTQGTGVAGDPAGRLPSQRRAVPRDDPRRNRANLEDEIYGHRVPFLIFAQEYWPEHVLVRLVLPSRVREAIAVVEQRREASAHRRSPRLIPVFPQPRSRVASLLALPHWDFEGIAVLVDCRIDPVRLFATILPHWVQREVFLGFLGIPSDSDCCVYVRDVPWPLQQGANIFPQSGDLITICARFTEPDWQHELFQMLEPRHLWDPSLDIPGDTDDINWVLSSGQHVALPIIGDDFALNSSDTATMLGLEAGQFALVPALPPIDDHARHGMRSQRVMAACPIHETDGDLGHRVPFVLDLRPVLLHLYVAYATDGLLDVGEICRRASVRCPRRYHVRLLGGRYSADIGNHYRQVRPGEVVTVEFHPDYLRDTFSTVHEDSYTPEGGTPSGGAGSTAPASVPSSGDTGGTNHSAGTRPTQGHGRQTSVGYAMDFAGQPCVKILLSLVLHPLKAQGIFGWSSGENLAPLCRAAFQDARPMSLLTILGQSKVLLVEPGCHVGPHETWISPTGTTGARLDYIAVPAAWRVSQDSSWVDFSLDWGQSRVDHYGICLDTFCIAKALKLGGHKVRNLDREAMASPEGRQTLLHICRTIPLQPWTSNVHRHYLAIERHLSQALAVAFPSPSGAYADLRISVTARGSSARGGFGSASRLPGSVPTDAWPRKALQTVCHPDGRPALSAEEVEDIWIGKDLDTYLLDVGDVPSCLELEQAFRQTQTGKAVGLDQVPGELLHFAAASASKAIFQLFLKTALRASEPVQFKGGALHAIWKGKSNPAFCSAHRGILVSSTVGKAFHKMARSRAIPALSHVATDMQIGGLPTFPVVLASHFVRLFQTGSRQRNTSHALLFLDLREAFYRVIRPLLVGTDCSDEQVAAAMQAVNLPPGVMHELHAHLQSISVAEEAGATDWADAAITEAMTGTWFRLQSGQQVVQTGVGSRPGDNLADICFSFIFAKVLRSVQADLCSQGLVPMIPLSKDMLGNIFPVISSTTCKVPALDATWMDDATFMITSASAASLPAALIATGTSVVNECVGRALLPNLDKGKTECVACPLGKGARQVRKDLFSNREPCVRLTSRLWPDSSVRLVSSYRHLGGLIHHDSSLTRELRCRAALAWKAFIAKKRQVFGSPCVCRKDKVVLFESLILSILLYGAGTWGQLSASEEATLHSAYHGMCFHMLRPAFTHEEAMHLGGPRVLAFLELPTLPTLLHVARLRHLLSCLRTSVPVFWAVLHWQGSWLESVRLSLRWLWTYIDGGYRCVPEPGVGSRKAADPGAFQAPTLQAQGPLLPPTQGEWDDYLDRPSIEVLECLAHLPYGLSEEELTPDTIWKRALAAFSSVCLPNRKVVAMARAWEQGLSSMAAEGTLSSCHLLEVASRIAEENPVDWLVPAPTARVTSICTFRDAHQALHWLDVSRLQVTVGDGQDQPVFVRVGPSAWLQRHQSDLGSCIDFSHQECLDSLEHGAKPSFFDDVTEGVAFVLSLVGLPGWIDSPPLPVKRRILLSQLAKATFASDLLRFALRLWLAGTPTALICPAGLDLVPKPVSGLVGLTCSRLGDVEVWRSLAFDWEPLCFTFSN